MIIPFELNGEMVYADSNPGERLVHILRTRFHLLSAKESCLAGRCGSCMVLMDGEPVLSCILPVFQVKNASIMTLESFLLTPEYTDIHEGFENAGVQMCGYCNAGKIFITHALLERNVRPTSEQIREQFSGILCRCTIIDDLISGVKKAATIKRKRNNAE